MAPAHIKRSMLAGGSFLRSPGKEGNPCSENGPALAGLSVTGGHAGAADAAKIISTRHGQRRGTREWQRWLCGCVSAIWACDLSPAASRRALPPLCRPPIALQQSASHSSRTTSLTSCGISPPGPTSTIFRCNGVPHRGGDFRSW